MKLADDFVSTPFPAGPQTARTRHEFTPGFADALGERLLTFDPAAKASLQFLRVTQDLAESPGFEAAVRARVEQAARLHHPNIAPARGVEWMDEGSRLAVVSNHVLGRRLSDVLGAARGAAFALELVRQIAPALAALQQTGPDVAHGLLTIDRIIVVRGGRLMLVDHVFGAAVESLWLPARRLRAEFGLAIPPGHDSVRLDAGMDVVQLGFMALMLLLGRRLDPCSYPAHITEELDAFAAEDPATSQMFRPWLERALQLGEPFPSAALAQEAFVRMMVSQRDQPAREEPRADPDAPAFQPRTPAPNAGVESIAPPPPAVAVATRPAAEPLASASSTDTRLDVGTENRNPVTTPTAIVPLASPAPAPQPSAATSDPAGRTPRGRLLKWPVAAVALTGGVIVTIVHLMGANTPPAGLSKEVAVVQARGADAGPAPALTPPAAAAPSRASNQPSGVDAHTTTVQTDAQAPQAGAARVADTASHEAVAARQGRVTVQSPVDLQVFDGADVLGASSSPLSLSEGSHTLVLVNDDLGYRAERTVKVKADQTSTISVTLPNGSLSINAVPWADVSVDGTPVGQTPLANVALPIGTHEVVFRHPSLGEQRRTVVVKANESARISAELQP